MTMSWVGLFVSQGPLLGIGSKASQKQAGHLGSPIPFVLKTHCQRTLGDRDVVSMRGQAH